MFLTTFAGELVFGSLSRLDIFYQFLNSQIAERKGTQQRSSPLNASQDSGNVICGAPSVLQNIQTELASGVYIWVKHLAYELH